MTLLRFSLIGRQDGKIGIFSAGKEAIVLEKQAFKDMFMEMVKRGHPEIMGGSDSKLEGIGIISGEMSETGWKTLVGLSRRLGAEIIS